MSEFDEFIARERSGGRLDSTGVFTLDPGKAMELMERYQLPERRAYILKLVQWALESRCTAIKIQVHRRQVILWHDGASVPASRVEELMEGTGRLDYLARGVYGAFGLEPERVSLLSQRRRYDLATGRTEPATLEGQAVVVTGIKSRFLERSPMVRSTLRQQWLHVDMEGPLQRLILDSTGLWAAESALVRWYCCYAPVPIWVNGALINRPIFLPVAWQSSPDGIIDLNPTAGRSGYFKFSACHGDEYLLAPSGPHSCSRFGWINSTELKLDADSKLRLAGEPFKRADCMDYVYTQGAPPSVVMFVQHGVVVDHLTFSYNPAHCMVIEASELPVSASGFGMVRNDDYAAKMRHLSDLLKVDFPHSIR